MIAVVKYIEKRDQSMTPPVSNLKIRQVINPDEQNKVFAFRYSIYFKEWKKDFQSADHGKQVITDSFDETAEIYAVFLNDEIVGTCRINYGSKEILPNSDLFQYAKFAYFYGTQNALISYLILKPEYRYGSLFFKFFKEIYRRLLQRDVRSAFLTCYEPWLPQHKKIGCWAYRKALQYADQGIVVPLVLLTRDHLRFRRVASPLLPLLESYLINDSSFREAGSEEWQTGRNIYIQNSKSAGLNNGQKMDG